MKQHQDAGGDADGELLRCLSHSCEQLPCKPPPTAITPVSSTLQENNVPQ